MTRLVEHHSSGPRKLDVSDVDTEKGDIAVCQCGLSDTYPFCDGTHRLTETEADDTVYWYDSRSDDGGRREIASIRFVDGSVEHFRETGEEP